MNRRGWMLAPIMDWLPLLGFAVATSVTPGPNTTLVAAGAALAGVRRMVPHMLGITVGFPAMLLLVAAGLAQPFAALPSLHVVMQGVGAAWLLVLAWNIATARPPGAAGARLPMGFWSAAAFQWVNPKAWMIALAAVPAFTRPEGAVLPQATLLAAVFALVSLPCLFLWAGIGAGARRLLPTQSRLRWFRRAMAALLVLSLLPMLG